MMILVKNFLKVVEKLEGDGAGIIEVWEGIEAENTEFHPQRGGKDVTGNC